MKLKFSIEKTDKYTQMTLDEEKLDTLKAPMLKTEFVSIFQSGTTNLIFDLSHVKYVDSSGLSAILFANRISREIDGSLVLTNISQHVMKVIKISKLDSVLSIFPTTEEAIDTVFLNQIAKDLDKQ